MNEIEEILKNEVSRRTFLARVGATGLSAAVVGALLAGCGSGSGTAPFAGSQNNNGSGNGNNNNGNGGGTRDINTDVLNFALNLEYLEAEYYLRAATGSGLNANEIGLGAGAVTGGRQVNFTTPAFQQYAQEIAADERAHVNFLRAALTSVGASPVSRPAIDLQASFNAAAAAAGIGSSFDPFANETNFLVGAFIFEDVGVTAYKGAATLLTNKDILEAAAGILGVEAYHAGEIRTILYNLGATTQNLANQISALRAAAGGGKEQALTVGGVENIVPTDSNSIAFGRTTSEVLRIVYLKASGAASSGGFFPNGLNGNIKAA